MADLVHIPASIGRQVWFWFADTPDEGEEALEVQDLAQGCAATVCFVHHPNLVNLLVVGHDGFTWSETHVELRDYDADFKPQHGDGSRYATWMPYQAEQARAAAVKAAAAEAIPAPTVDLLDPQSSLPEPLGG